MKTSIFSVETLYSYFQRHTIATMEQLKKALGTPVDMTVYRKLRQLSYRTSYSHQGKYYTLHKLAKFNCHGLWEYEDARFSKYGTLIQTAEALIDKSDKGYTLFELRSMVGIEVKETLLRLHQQGRVKREQVAGRYVYFSCDPVRCRKQHLLRLEEKPLLGTTKGSHLLAHEARAAIILFFSVLDERQRRLYAGLESLRLGHGGDSLVSSLFDIDPHTVAKGRRELMQRDVKIERIRRKGGGRHHIKKNSADH